MDHIVFLDAGSSELDNLIDGKKSMILRGDDLVSLSCGNVTRGDTLYFIESRTDWNVRARGVVASVYKSGRLSVEESYETIIRNQDKLQLPDNQFYSIAGKQFLILITVEDVEEIAPMQIEKLDTDQTYDWIPVGNIDLVMADQTG
jgi:hypothetical protein